MRPPRTRVSGSVVAFMGASSVFDSKYPYRNRPNQPLVISTNP
jgi:hypothetical protein